MSVAARTWDAVVAGAGPAGAAAALALARAGASVLLVERSAFPRWKVCGACLSPGAQSSLEALGASDLAVRSGAVPLADIRLRHRGGVARLPLEGWRALSRTTLDTELVHEAERAGVTFWCPARARLGQVDHDAYLVRVTKRGSEEDEIEVRARLVADATGLGRGLDEDGHATTVPAAGARIGIGAELDAPDYPVARGELHMAVGRFGYVGLVRVEDGRLNVAAAVDAPALRSGTPELVARGILSEAGLPPLPATASHGWRGTPQLDRSGEDSGAARLLRLGDAAGYVEPFTGEGIGWALGDGRAAADVALALLQASTPASVAAALATWKQYRTDRRATAERLCRVLSRGLRRPWMVSLALATIRSAPRLALPLVRRAGRSPLGLAAAGS
jgi:flavin-dependent dehydrogenase